MADIFANTELKYGGGFKGNVGLLSASAGTITGALMQSIQVSYQQRVNQLYEIGVQGPLSNVYYMQGRPSGTLNAARILGPGVALQTFYTKFSDVCECYTNTISIHLQPGLCTGVTAQTPKYTTKFCVLVQIALGAQAQDLIINESVNLMFGNMEQ